MSKSKIEWTNASWNPVRGCTPISPGCKNCYAKRFAERFRGVKGHPYEQGFDVRLVPEKLDEPLRWKTPKMVFVNSMSDLFHEAVPDWFITKLDVQMQHEVCARAGLRDGKGHPLPDRPSNIYQILTKRPARLRDMSIGNHALGDPDCKNIWWGVSVEDRKHGLPRIELLRQAEVGVRFLSIEPLLEDLGELDLSGIDWVICGGESGPGARPIHIDWVRNVRDSCIAQRVPFFFKQWGGIRPKSNGCELDGREWKEFPPNHLGM